MLINDSDIDVPQIDLIGLGLPTFWSREPVQLDPDTEATFVFLARFALPFQDGQMFLYGAKFQLANAYVGGARREANDSGYFLEFYVLGDRADGTRQVWRLAQTRSITFSDEPEPSDFVAAKSCPRSLFPTLGKLPEWKWAEANWPKVDDILMTFVLQQDLLETQVNREYLTWNERVFLFVCENNGKVRFKIVTQQVNFQSARGHYQGEALRGRGTP